MYIVLTYYALDGFIYVALGVTKSIDKQVSFVDLHKAPGFVPANAKFGD